MIVDNTLDRQFDVDEPDLFWVTDITYIKTMEGFAYLAVVIDLYSRRVIGWSLQSRPRDEEWQTALVNANVRDGTARKLCAIHPKTCLLLTVSDAEFSKIEFLFIIDLVNA